MNENETNIPAESEILVNNDQLTHDPTVVVAEADRTVVLTEEETIIIDKPMHVEVMPSNRPRKVYGGMWGPMEIGALGVSLFALLSLLALYLLWVAPAGRAVEQTRAERVRLEEELISARSKYGGITSTQTAVEKLVSSVTDFEAQYLPIAATGRTGLYQRLNGLIAAYGLVNTNGPNYAPLDMEEQQTGSEQNEQERGRAKFKSIFPGVYATMTLEGSYENLRRFISDIETAGDFVIISSVELEPTEAKEKKDDPSQPPSQSEQNQLQGFPGMSDPRNPNRGMMPNQPVQQSAPRQQGKTHGEVVSLRLEMAAYFRREVTAPVAAPSAQ